MNRLEQGVCILCGLPLTVERTDSIPLHGECEKEVRQKAMNLKKKGNPTKWICMKGMRYVPPSG